MFNRRLLLATTLAGSLAMASSALAQSASQPVVGMQTVTTYSADARITAVDPAARTLTLAFSNGAVVTRKVSSAVANFGATKVGDMVSVAFEDKLAFVLSGPQAKTPSDRAVGVAAAAQAGQSMAGVAGEDSVTNWWVTAVNPNGGTISLVNPAGGPVRTYTVTTQAGREQLSRVKPGDNLTVINRDVLVVGIAPKA